MRNHRPFCAGYLDFCVILRAATTFDSSEFEDWVKARPAQLTAGYMHSDEEDPAVYTRMQYARSIGIAV